MAGAKAARAPAAKGVEYNVAQGPQSGEERGEMLGVPYRHAIGSLLYAARGSRPDILSAVNVLSRFMENPGKTHWAGGKQIFCYLLGIMNFVWFYVVINR